MLYSICYGSIGCWFRSLINDNWNFLANHPIIIIIIIIIIINLITLLNIRLLEDLHVPQFVSVLRLSVGKEIHPTP